MSVHRNSYSKECEEHLGKEIPACAGEVILHLINKLSLLFKGEMLSHADLSVHFNHISKAFLGSTYTQVYIKEEHNLTMPDDPSSLKNIPIDNSSFQGFIATNKLYQIVNQVQKSGVLKSFENQYYPSDETLQHPVELVNICGVPILNEEREIFAVIFMYSMTSKYCNISSYFNWYTQKTLLIYLKSTLARVMNPIFWIDLREVFYICLK